MIKDDFCCSEFTSKDVKKWDKKIINWKNKKFIKGKVFSLFFIPINFGQVMKRMYKNVKISKAKIINNLCLSAHSSKWNMDVYLAVDKKVKNEENVIISGKFLSKVYEGDYKDTEKWCDDFTKYAKKKKVIINNWFMWYTTCPKCAKKYKKKYTVIIAKI
jgi:hydrolase family protein